MKDARNEQRKGRRPGKPGTPPDGVVDRPSASGPVGAPLDIAIIGLSGCFAGARDARAYWQNILNKVDAVAEADPDWTGPYYEAKTTANDRTYTTRGGFLRELAEVNPVELGVMPALVEGADPDHLLALKHARDALVDAGYLGAGRSFDPERAGVVIGRGTYGNRAMASVMTRGLFLDQAIAMAWALRPDLSSADLEELRQHFRSQLPAYNADVVGVTTPNVIAGLIANRLNLMGPNYIVDAACASALFALNAAVQELAAGHCDLMVTGAVQSHTPPQLYIQFSQIGALSRDKIRPFQRGADGILLGEGVGMLVLKRLADAERDGDRIYAVIKGIGLASDGKAKGLLAPRAEGQILALRRAYERSGIDPRTVDLIEAHGTGTEVGDRTEMEVLQTVFKDRGAGPQIAVGTVKSMIGHCLPAAGIASLIKTTLALHHRILPPTLCDEPNPALVGSDQPLYINNQTRPWIHGGAEPRRAGVNAFGFGGANAHVVLEEYTGHLGAPPGTMPGTARSELLTLAADDDAGLVQLAEAALAHLQAAVPMSLSELARTSAKHDQGHHRLAIVAESAEETAEKLASAIELLNRPEAVPSTVQEGIFLGTGLAAGKVCFLFPGEAVFPGEGTQYPEMLRDLCLHYPQVRKYFDGLDRSALRAGAPPRSPLLFPPPTGLDAHERADLTARLAGELSGFEYTSAASLALLRLLGDAGLQAGAMLGYGAGEMTAIAGSGGCGLEMLDEHFRYVREFCEVLVAASGDSEEVDGALVFADALWPETRESLLQKVSTEGSGLHLVADNCPNQMTVFARRETAESIRRWLSDEGSIVTLVPAGQAFHTPIRAALGDELRRRLGSWAPGSLSVPLYSACSAAVVSGDVRSIHESFCSQWGKPLRFADTVQQLYADGFRIFVEVGPGSMLTQFVRDTLSQHGDVTAVACDRRGQSSVRQTHLALASLFAAGAPVRPAGLHEHRDTSELDLLSPPRSPARAGMPLKRRMPELTIPSGWRPLPGV